MPADLAPERTVKSEGESTMNSLCGREGEWTAIGVGPEVADGVGGSGLLERRSLTELSVRSGKGVWMETCAPYLTIR